MLLVLLVLAAIGLLLSRPMRHIPGPFLSSFTGIVLKYHEFRGNRRLYVHKLHDKYGPVVRIAPNEVSFATAAAAKEIYASGGAGYDKTEFYSIFERFGVRNMFSTLTKAAHSVKRRALAEPYSNSHVLRPDAHVHIEQRAREFADQCRGVVDIYHLFYPHGTRSLAGDLAMVDELSFADNLTVRLVKYYAPWLSELLGSDSADRVKGGSLVDRYIHDCVAEDADSWTVRHRLTWGPLETASECSDHLSAGIDTTGDALCFLMYELSRPENHPLQAQLSDDRWLDAVIKEGLRCFPPIPMSLPRYSPGRTIEGYYVPEKTIVSCQAWTLHRSPVFVDAERFMPERWLDASSEMDRHFFAFASGGRGCIGKNLALAEMRALLRAVYSGLRSSIPDEMTASMALSDQVISSRPAGKLCKLRFSSIEPSTPA